MLLQIAHLSQSFASGTLFKDAGLTIQPLDKMGLIGPNGSGKTTLLKIITQQLIPDHGEIHKPAGLKIGLLEQMVFVNEDLSVRDVLSDVFAQQKHLEQQMQQLEQEMATNPDERTLARYARVQQQFESMGGWQMESEMNTVLTRFGFTDEVMDRPLHTFSGGQKTKLGFARLLLSHPDLLLLDEPTNHLDLQTIEWLEGYLQKYPHALLIISHDRMFLDHVCNRIAAIEQQQIDVYTGNYSAYLLAREQNRARMQRMYDQQQQEIKRLEQLIEKFRYKKSKAAFAQSKIKYLERMEKIEAPDQEKGTFRAAFHARLRGGKDVLTLDQLSFGYTSEHPLGTVDLIVRRGRKIAVTGPNGCGKSTLLKTIVGKLPVLGGSMMFGHQIEMGYFAQDLNQFDASKTVLEELWDRYPDLDKTKVRMVLGRFLFTQDEVFKQVSVLSGGEKVRLSLAELMLQDANFLILDEPTNHLDIPAKEALEEALRDYEGTILFVSHDRYFISRIADAHLDFTPEGLVYQEQATAIVDKPVLPTDGRAEEKKQRRESYETLRKQRREIEKIEKDLQQKQAELEALRALRYEPDYYHDQQKMQALDEQIDDKHNEIAHLEARWEQLQLLVEEQTSAVL